jgi:hypothetical protein
MTIFRTFSFLGCLFFSLVSVAADPAIYFHKKKGAIGGADVVAYFSLEPGADGVMGDRNIAHEYEGATFYFSNEENKAKFIENPDKYLPQYGGYCAFAASHGFTKPIDIDRWHIVDGKLYLNYNYFADRKWLKDRDAAIVRADKNWPALLKACEEHNNCIEH